VGIGFQEGARRAAKRGHDRRVMAPEEDEPGPAQGDRGLMDGGVDRDHAEVGVAEPLDGASTGFAWITTFAGVCTRG
jgi:hypothetical protein